jgi:hypothetical protein
VDITTNKAPYGKIESAMKRTNGSGVVDISIKVSDKEHQASRAKLEYVAGDGCDFSSPQKAALDAAQSNISATLGVPLIDNSLDYQIGKEGGYILTTALNTVQFDWLSKSDLPDADGVYCLRLTVNDGLDDGLATTTIVTLDNLKPTAPAPLASGGVSTSSIRLMLSSGSDTNFSHYKIFYKQGTSGVSESDTEHIDGNLNYINFNGADGTTVSGLLSNTDYVFNIWIYDSYGNSDSSTEVSFRTDATIINNSLVFVNPAAGNYAIAGTGNEWTFRASVSEGNGFEAIDHVLLRLANANDKTAPFNDLEFKWSRAGGIFSKTGADIDNSVSLSPNSSADCSGNTCVLDFKLIFNHRFSNTSTDYSAQLYSVNDSAVYDEDLYVDIYQAKLILVKQLHYRWRNDDGGE